MRFIFPVWILAVATLVWGGAIASSGWAETKGKDPAARVEELRREQRAARKWIQVPEIDVHAARDLLGEEGVAFVDVTCPEKGKKWKRQIVGSRWRDWTRVEEWAPEYAEVNTLIVYCA